MPSLQALEEFKSSFYRLGNEPQILDELEIQYDDLPLPEPSAEDEMAGSPPVQGPAAAGASGADFSGDAELADLAPADMAGPFEEAAEAEGAEAGSDILNFGDLGDLLGGMDSPVPDISADALEESFDDAGSLEIGELETGDLETGDLQTGSLDAGDLPAAGQEDIDFGSLVDAIPDDLSPPDSAVPAEGEPFEDAAGFPPDLLDGFADEIEAGRAESELPEEVPADDAVESDFPGQDLGDSLDLSDLGLSDLGLGDQDSGELPDLDLGEIGESLDLGEIGVGEIDEGIDLSGEEALAGEDAFGDGFDLSDLGVPHLTPSKQETSDQGLGDFDLGDLSGLGEEEGFDLGGETADVGIEADLEEISGDSFNNIEPLSDEPAGDTAGGDDFGSLEDDFSLPKMEGVFDGSVPTVRTVVTRTAARAGEDLEMGDGADEVEEIRMTEAELNKLQDTLASYPLNLRIACEELIAEEVVAPDQLSKLLRLLINGAPPSETAAVARQILGRTIPVPKGFEKKTGEALEAEQASFAYIFINNFLPVLRLFMAIALVLLSAGYLTWKFIYMPVKAENIYKLGIERIEAGEYSRANERFREAYGIHQKKSWFYTYARAFRDARQYTLAEEKYKELLYYTASKNKRQIPEKAAVLEYADLETSYIGNYEAADQILRNNILDYNPRDRDALLALGDNSLAWGEYEPSRLENAREYYATYMERYGRSDPLLERMLIYFIRTDNLGEVLPLQSHFMESAKRKISAAALAELGAYLLDKRYEKVQGVPNEYLDRINGIREVLLRAIRQDSMLPESYYHLARYYNYYSNFSDEKMTLELAVRVFDAAKTETPKRIKYHIFTLDRYAEVLIGVKEFFPAEEALLKAVRLYQDGLSRRLLVRSPEFGRLYAELGDLEFFVKDGDMQSALDYYLLGEQHGWAPPEIQYRMGAALYQLRQWESALDRFFAAFREMPPNRRILYALGNVSYMRGNYFAAQGYYDRLLAILEDDRARLSPIMATNDEKQLDLAERLMVAQNNQGVILEGLTERTGNSRYRSRAQALYSDSERAWDILTRNPVSMMRMRPSSEISAPGINPAYLNVQNSLHPVPGYEPHFFLRIDKDMNEPSVWEELAPPGYRLSEGIYTGR